MTNEEIYENVMGHKPNKEFGIKGSFSWADIDALMNAVSNSFISKLQEIIYSDLSDSEIVNALHKLDNEQLCQYEPDNTTAMNCKHCGNPKWVHKCCSLT